ncbi:CAPG protein, partial [Menura novaehollandiae]|nr:CAPG protein [Menura novaehollandiae]
PPRLTLPAPHSGSPFGPAAARPGLHIWRVEQLRPVEVPEASLGVFFSGDAYLVLHNGPEEQAHLHLWMGQDSSQDERGACALLSTQLSLLLGERPVTHREVQGNESDLFMEYFPRGLTYQQEGGVASAFKCSRPGPGPGPAPKLYQVKGKRKIRASERDPAWASFNTGDCFLLDLGQTLFIWCGARSNVLERSRAQELAAAIRDSKQGGKAHLEIVADGEEPPEMVQVLGPKPLLQEGSPEEDVVADQTNAGAAVLYKARTWWDTMVSDAMGRMDLSQVAAGSPFDQSLLCPDDCFVLDNGAGGKVYIWKGRKANEQERQAALRVAEEVITRMGHPPQTQVRAAPCNACTLLTCPCHHAIPVPVPLPIPSPCPCHSHPCASHPSCPMPSPCHLHCCVIPMPLPMPFPSPLFTCPRHPQAHAIFIPVPSPCPCHSPSRLHASHSYPCAMPMSSLPLCHSLCHPCAFAHPMPIIPVHPCAIPMFPCPCHFLPHSHAHPVPCPCHVLLVPTPSLCHSHLHTIPKSMSFLPLCYPIIPIPLPTPCLSPSPSLHH